MFTEMSNSQCSVVSGVSGSDASSYDNADPLHLGNSRSLWDTQSISRSYLLELEDKIFFWESWSNFIDNGFDKELLFENGCKKTFTAFYDFLKGFLKKLIFTEY